MKLAEIALRRPNPHNNEIIVYLKSTRSVQGHCLVVLVSSSLAILKNLHSFSLNNKRAY